MALRYSYKHTPRLVPLLYTTMGDLLSKWSEKYPERNALVVRTPCGRDTISFRDLFNQSELFAKHLVRHGIKTGDLVGVFVTNSTQWLVANMGVTMAGGAALNSYSYAQNDNFDWLHRAGCTSLIIDFRFDNVYEELVKKTENLCFKYEISGSSIPITYIPNDHKTCEVSNWESFNKTLDSRNDACVLPTVSPEDICYVFQSSGSTGLPKHIAHQHARLINNGNVLYDNLNITSDDIFWSPRPMGYGAGFPLTMITRGSTFVTINKDLTLDADNLSQKSINIIEEEKVNTGYLAPYFVFDLKEILKTRSFPRFKATITAGQRISAQSMMSMYDVSERATEGYGTVESMWNTFTHLTDRSLAEDDVMGDPIPGVEIKIVDSNGKTVPIGETGEIYIRSPYLLSHYLSHDGKKVTAIDNHGWFHTGDLGYFTEDGRSYIKGRSVEVISKFAGKIFPASIETELLKHPDIKEVCAVGTPNERMYEDIAAVVTLKPDSKLTLLELQDFAKKKFRPDVVVRQATLMPSYFFIEQSLPKLQSGKINRFAIKELAKKRVEELLSKKSGLETS